MNHINKKIIQIACGKYSAVLYEDGTTKFFGYSKDGQSRRKDNLNNNKIIQIECG